MNGMEQLKEHLQRDVQTQVERRLAQAREEAAAVAEAYAGQAEQLLKDGLERGRAAARQREERLAGVAVMDSRKALLSAKQEMLDKAFERAMARLERLPREEKCRLLARLAVQAARTGSEEVVLSPADRQSVGEDVVALANRQVPGGGLTLSPRGAPMRGGLILKDGDVEVNCTFETLLRLARHELAGEVAGILFQ